MLGAILVVWMVGIPLAAVAATGVAVWRRERTLTRLATRCPARVPVPLLAVLSLYPRAHHGSRIASAHRAHARCRVPAERIAGASARSGRCAGER